MKVLIADDDNVNRRILERFLLKWGYNVVAVNDGDEARRLLQSEDAPPPGDSRMASYSGIETADR